MSSSDSRTWLLLAAIAFDGCGQPSVASRLPCGTRGASIVNEHGFPETVEHCGECDLDCREVFPSAVEVGCRQVSGPIPICVVETCPDGSHLVGTSFCAFDHDVLCMPCDADDACAFADPNALCLELPNGDRRCGRRCGVGDGCPPGFACIDQRDAGQCQPTSGECGCTPDSEGAAFGCRVADPSGTSFCPGTRTCEADGLSPCEPLYEERCDGEDNDCDGEVDEGFLAGGLYLDAEHCGACNHPCTPHVPSLEAACEAVAGVPTCTFSCRPGYVDVDGLTLNGCECELHDATWPPAAHGVDGNCDGQVDDTTGFVYVSKNGHDVDPGTLDMPVATISRGIQIASGTGRSVAVAQGVYDEEVQLAAGVSVFGGYRADFAARDVVVFAVTVTHARGPPGRPVVWGTGIKTPTEVSGLVIRGTDGASPGGGSTAVRLAECGPELALSEITVVAGSGADGRDGSSSAAVLAALGVGSVAALDGLPGGSGEGGLDAGSVSCTGVLAAAGAGGAMVCPLSGATVSGGDGGDAVCPATGCMVGAPCANSGCSDFTIDGVCDFAAVLAAAIPNAPGSPGHGPAGGAAGPLTYDAPTTRAGSDFCNDNVTLRREGGQGEDGGVGTDGTGGSGYTGEAGLFDRATAIWTGGSGADGTDGRDGSGGGGGTPGAGYDVIPGGGLLYDDHTGGAGGGGGAGGCGAPGALGGQGGGGSIAVAILLSPGRLGPTLTHVRAVPARAGSGGDGGGAAAGGSPGSGGLGGPGNFWCARRGGRGGDGGRGGAAGGGGGGGGGSISGFHVLARGDDASAYVAALEAANSVDPLPAAGQGGAGGYSPAGPGTTGDAGSSEAFRIMALP